MTTPNKPYGITQHTDGSQLQLGESISRASLKDRLVRPPDMATVQRRVAQVIEAWPRMADEWWPLAHPGRAWPTMWHTPTANEVADVVHYLYPDVSRPTARKRCWDKASFTGKPLATPSAKPRKCQSPNGGGTCQTFSIAAWGKEIAGVK